MDLSLEFCSERLRFSSASAAVIVACSPSISSFSVVLQNGGVTSLNKNHVEKKSRSCTPRKRAYHVAYNDIRTYGPLALCLSTLMPRQKI